MGTKIIREGRWDCAQCNAKKILGRYKACPTCGDPRNPTKDPSEEPYLLDGEPEVTDPDLINLFTDGPDWNCSFCGTANKASSEGCSSCGNTRTEEHNTYNQRRVVEPGVIHTPIKKATRSPHIDELMQDATHLVEDHDFKLNTPDPLVGYKMVDKRRKIDTVKDVVIDNPIPFIAGLVVLVFVVLGTFIYQHWIATDPIKLTVSSFTWERGIEVEQYRTLHESSFDTPPDARITRSYQAIHHYNHVLDHYDTQSYTDYEYESESYSCSETVSNGNGGFETESRTCTRSVSHPVTKTRQVPVYRDDPVYATKYDFDVDRWVESRWLETSGADHNALWAGTESAIYKDVNILGQERIGDQRHEQYKVLLTGSNKKQYNRQINFDIWKTLTVDEVLTGQINHAGNIRGIDWKVKTQ